jgi:predicted esterase
MPPADDLGFIHKFIPAKTDESHPVTLLLLHGTGGDESDLLSLGDELWPGAARLGVRGKVLENGMPRFFRRISEGVFDLEDLKFRTEELARFIKAASERYDFRTEKLIAVGYSNGANIAASLLLLHPGYLAAAALSARWYRLRPASFAISEISPFSLAPVIATRLFPEASLKNSMKFSRAVAPT